MEKNKVKKVLILGIDAIEYDLVEEWNLKNLKQKEYGKTELPLVSGQEPITVIVWPCFITGRMPKDMGYSTLHVFPQPLQTLAERIYPMFRKKLVDYEAEDITAKKKGKQSLLNKTSKILFKLNLAHIPTRKDIKAKTMFDWDNIKSVHLNLPVYDNGFPPYRKNIVKAIEDSTYRPIIEMAGKEVFNKRTKEVFDLLKKKDEWDLFMQYFFVLDGIQHVFFKNTNKIAKFYIMFDQFVGKVRKEIDDDTLLLIVSDHGQKKGIHTNYGFYSVSKPLGLRHPRLIDFKKIIRGLLEDGHQ